MASKNYAARKLNARRDTVDFRDRMYESTLVEVPVAIELSRYLKALKNEARVLDQGSEGACTGFALATVVHYLLRTRKVAPDLVKVSPHMLYAMARRYDEWPGERYEGSSARGAMKGWQKHGVCSATLWKAGGEHTLTDPRARDGLKRPLGAYYRVNHRDLVAMHAALAEVGVLFATADVHVGWDDVDAKTGVIPYPARLDGGHAFAIVGYNARGFLIQNSWGEDWGRKGFALLTYEDWLENGSDVWVARLGVPLEAADETEARRGAPGRVGLARQVGAYSHSDLRPHVIHLGNDGRLWRSGPFATSPDDIRAILHGDFARITAGWKSKRLLLYAHGGLVGEQAALERVADYREPLLANEIYPLAFVWRTGMWSNMTNILREAIAGRRAEGILDAAKDFMLDRIDDTLEPLARVLSGKAQWDEIKENALYATMRVHDKEEECGGARLVLRELAKMHEAPEIHVAGHSAGSVFMAPVVWSLTAKPSTPPPAILRGCEGMGRQLRSCTLWAPACTVDLFRAAYRPAIEADAIDLFSLFTLTDVAEQDDHCGYIYNKSLLYLVSNAFEAEPRVPILRPHGEPLLGMEKFIDDDLAQMFETRANADWIRAPNSAPDVRDRSHAQTHGSFDDDEATVLATLARILARDPTVDRLVFEPSASYRRDRRTRIERVF